MEDFNLPAVIEKKMRAMNISRQEAGYASGVTEQTQSKFFSGKTDLKSSNLIALCEAIGLPIIEFFERGGLPNPDPQNPYGPLNDWIDTAPPESLMIAKRRIYTKMPWAEIYRTRDVRAKALEDKNASAGIRNLARNELLWFSVRPTGEEVAELEQRRSLPEGPEQYAHEVFKLRERHRRDAERAGNGAIEIEERDLAGIVVYDIKPKNKNVVEKVGYVAAGHPICDDQHEGWVVTEKYYAHSTHFACEIRGDSMIDDRLFPGDIIVIQRQSTASNGDTVVATIDAHEPGGGGATVKRYYKDGKNVRLSPANPNLSPIIYAAKRVRIEGVVVDKISSF